MRGFSRASGTNQFENQLPAEEEIDNGLALFVRKKTLYHGSGISGIKVFNAAEEDTVGSGVYLTSEAKDATGYARIRSKRERFTHKADGSPVIKDSEPYLYETSIENLKLCDLRKNENVKIVLEGFKEVLKEERKKPDIPWSWQGALDEIIETISNGKVGGGNLKEVGRRTGKMFSDYVESLGYAGLITLEGGEESVVGNHDTYLIFDPKKVRIEKEQKVS
ncbi:MAG TPA: hypothetical protein VI957_03430 [Candidatus Paceibacterota bacterium]